MLTDWRKMQTLLIISPLCFVLQSAGTDEIGEEQA